MRIYLFADNRTYSGTEVEIVNRMAKNANFLNLPPEEYMAFVSRNTKLDIRGETFEERCKSFVTALLQKGDADIAEKGTDGHKGGHMQGPPVDPVFRRSPQEDLDLYDKAINDMEKFFPSELFIQLVIECWTEMDKTNNREQEVTEMAEHIKQMYEEFRKQLPPEFTELAEQISEIQDSLETPQEGRARFAKSECEVARSDFIHVWLDSLYRLNKAGPMLEGRRLNENLWPPDVPPEYITLNRYLFSENSIPQVMAQFATNVKTAVDASPDGLVILPKNSKDIELWIKKDAAGYYLA